MILDCQLKSLLKNCHSWIFSAYFCNYSFPWKEFIYSKILYCLKFIITVEVTYLIERTLFFFTAKWIWDRSISSIIKPLFDIVLFLDLWRFAKICKDMSTKLLLLLFLNNIRHATITKTIFSFISVQIVINTGTMPCQMMAQVSKW